MISCLVMASYRFVILPVKFLPGFTVDEASCQAVTLSSVAYH